MLHPVKNRLFRLLIWSINLLRLVPIRQTTLCLFQENTTTILWVTCYFPLATTQSLQQIISVLRYNFYWIRMQVPCSATFINLCALIKQNKLFSSALRVTHKLVFTYTFTWIFKSTIFCGAMNFRIIYHCFHTPPSKSILFFVWLVHFFCKNMLSFWYTEQKLVVHILMCRRNTI